MVSQIRGERSKGRAGARGFGIFGMLLTLVLVGVGVGIAVGVYEQASRSAARNQAVSLLTQLRSALDELGSHYSSYGTGSLVAALDARDGIPKAARQESSTGTVTVEHPFGGAVTVTGATNQYSIAFAALDKAACVWLADAYAGGSGGRSGLVELKLNAAAQALPLAVGDASGGCNLAGATNAIEFVFR